MKKILALMLVVSSTVALAQRGRHAVQQETLVLHLNQHLTGQSVIKLKQQLKAQYRHINLQNMKLDSVRLVAKSKQGRGEATLVVGQNTSYPALVGGSPYNFQSQRPYTFSRINMMNPSRSSQGKWQIETKGNIKVKRVVVLVSKKMMNQMKTVVIPMYGHHSKGLSTLKLKQLIKQQRPTMDLTQMKLKEVTLIAKSKAGRGEATLITGQTASYPARVSGGQRVFHSQAPRTFHQVVLSGGNADMLRKVQVELKGNIKVKEVIVKMQKMGTVAHGPVIQTPNRRRSGRRN